MRTSSRREALGGPLQATIPACRSERPGSPRHCKDFTNYGQHRRPRIHRRQLRRRCHAGRPAGPCGLLGRMVRTLPDAHAEVATQFGIMSIPTVIILKNGEIAKKFVGLASKDDIAAAIDAAM